MNILSLNLSRLRVVWLLAAALCGGLPAIAQTNAPARPASGRYLIVVETSSAMKRRAENTQAVLGALMVSGLNGQLRDGDTIGVWTFSDEVQAGQFPLQRWNAQSRHRTAKLLVEFLRGQKHEKKANLAKVMEGVSPLVKDSDKLTVLLVTDGSSQVSGTPYDAEINDVFKKSSSEQKKQKMPFVTVLRTKQGEFIGNKVGLPPWPVEFPAFPPEPKPVAPQKKDKASTPTPTAKPLIVIGNTNPPPPVVPVQAAPPTNPPAPPPTDQAPPLSTITPSAPTPHPPVEPVKPETTPEAASTATPPPPPPPPVATESAPPVQPAAVEKTEPASVPTGSAPISVAAASNPLLTRTNLLIAGGALILGAGVFLIALLRRPAKHAGKISLITHSIDREEK